MASVSDFSSMAEIVTQKKKGQEKMNMNWADWAVLVTMAVVMFFIPIVIGKYIDVRVRLSMKTNELNWSRHAASMGFLLAAKMCRCVLGRAFAILPDGRVFSFPGSMVAEASILGCEEVFFEVLTDRDRKGLNDQEIKLRVPDLGTLWRGKMGDVIVYFEKVYGKELVNGLGVDARDAAAFHVELQSVRAGIAAKAAKSGKEEMEVSNG